MRGIGRTMSEIRPVDANALVKQLSFELEHDCDIYLNCHQKCERDAKFEFCIDRIKEAPTINPDDLRPHGRWIQISKARYYEESDRYICSICGSIDENGEQDFEVTIPPYCEYCGAKMNGKDGADMRGKEDGDQ